MTEKFFLILLFLFGILTGPAIAGSGFHLEVGTDDFYLSVGNYDFYDQYVMEAVPPPSYGPVPPPVEIDFTAILSDYGRWIEYPGLGPVWSPFVTCGWQPYTWGHWVWTQYGPTWVSYEPWGWLPHHYGSWYCTDIYGWIWIPGYRWYPSNVQWVVVDNLIGWSPIPPPGFSHYFSPGPFSGYSSGVQVNYNTYVFIENNYFFRENVGDHHYNGNVVGQNMVGRRIEMLPAPPDRRYIQNFTRTNIPVVPLRELNFNVSGKKAPYYIPEGQDRFIRQYAPVVVERTVAPSYQKMERPFVGRKAKYARQIDRVFQQKEKKPATRAYQTPVPAERPSSGIRKDQPATPADERKIKTESKAPGTGTTREARETPGKAGQPGKAGKAGAKTGGEEGKVPPQSGVKGTPSKTTPGVQGTGSKAPQTGKTRKPAESPGEASQAEKERKAGAKPETPEKKTPPGSKVKDAKKKVTPAEEEQEKKKEEGTEEGQKKEQEPKKE